MQRKSLSVLIGSMLVLLVVGLWAIHEFNADAKLFLSYLNYASAQTVLPRPACAAPDVLIPNSYHVEALNTNSEQQLVVLYSAECAPANHSPTNVVGLRFYDGLNDGGRVMFGPSRAIAPTTTPLTYSVGVTGGPESYTVVWGQVVMSQAATVEVQFGDGQLLARTPANHQYFILAPGAVLPCELHVLDSNRVLLASYVLSGRIPEAAGLNGSCLPAERPMDRDLGE